MEVCFVGFLFAPSLSIFLCRLGMGRVLPGSYLPLKSQKLLNMVKRQRKHGVSISIIFNVDSAFFLL